MPGVRTETPSVPTRMTGVFTKLTGVSTETPGVFYWQPNNKPHGLKMGLFLESI